MVSRKKSQGKARKAAKAKAREEAEERERFNGQQKSLATQLDRWEMGDALPISQNGVVKCLHGFENNTYGTHAQLFGITFRLAFYEDREGGRSLPDCLVWAENATLGKYSDVWKDSATMEMMISFFLFSGAEDILEGYNCSARECAVFARYFKQHIAIDLYQTQATINWPKIDEAYEADEHTLVKFFRRWIPCTCLDKKYEEVKSITKIGFCSNLQCKVPHGKLARSETKYCSRCRSVTYCSRECQKAHWSLHKLDCDRHAVLIADFEAEQQS
jgi:hypothetical protein